MNPVDKDSNSIPISYLRLHMFALFNLMRDTGVTLRVSHRRKIYNLNIRPTGDKVTTAYRKSKINPNNKIDPSLVSSDTCKECKELVLNGLCMNKQCPTNNPTL